MSDFKIKQKSCRVLIPDGIQAYTVIFICRLYVTHNYHMCLNPLTPKKFMGNPPYCLPYNLCDVKFENVELDQPIILKLIFVLILVTCLHTNSVRRNSV